MSGLKKLISEVHRRSLWQVLGIYGVGSWVVLQIVDTLGAALNLPEWAPSLALFLLIVGLPIVLATAIVQEGIRPSLARPAREKVVEGEAAGAAGEVRGGTRGLFTWRNAISGGIAAFALWGVVAAGWVALGGAPGREAPAEGERVRVAVLPFENLSGDPEDDYFSDGITDDVITQLTRIRGLAVISRASVMQYKDTRKSIPEIGAELRATAVLRGGIRREGDRVRINTQLIDVATDDNVWADTYNRELTDVFQMQSELAMRIATALQATLSAGERERLEQNPEVNPEAYELYHRGRQLWHSRTSLDQAVDYFTRAIELDSTYAQAYSAVAATYALLPNYGYASAGTSYPATIEYARRALALDSTLAEPNAALAMAATFYEWDWDAAERLYERAIELNPSYATGHYWYAYQLFRRGRIDEGMVQADAALELDPLSPNMAAGIAGRLYNVRLFEEAESRLRDILVSHPSLPSANLWLGALLVATNRPDEGIEAMERAVALAPTAESLRTILAAGYAAVGRDAQAREILAFVEQEDMWRRSSPAWIAAIYGGLGETDTAFAWLERAYEERDEWLANVRTEPLFDPLRSDPRFAEIARRIGLELPAS